MSKAALKKELQTMTHQQLMETILDAYSARPEIKEYFEFFLNPDVEKLMEKFKISVAKEFGRVKHRYYSKARISQIKKIIKQFESFQPGAEWVIEFRLFVINYAVLAEGALNFSRTLYDGVIDILMKTLTLSEASGHSERVISAIQNLITDSSAGSRYFSKLLQDSLNEYLYAPHVFSSK